MDEPRPAAAPPHLPELSSWKEIAGYLGVSVRTAQGWERDRGLPVRRLAGPRGRVFVVVSELEAWKNSASTLSIVSAPARGGDLRREAHHWWIAGVIGIAAVSGILLGLHFVPGEPAVFRIEQNSLIVTDDSGRELWRKTFPALARLNGDERRYGWVGDLDGDGHREILFAPPFIVDEPTETPLICYSHKGVERWRFAPGAVRTATESFAATFGVQRFVVARLGRQHALRIVMVSQHQPYYPSQVALLSPDGKLLREYWHSGGLGALLLTDIDGDGLQEILVAGVNNATKQATLIALDPDTMAGASREGNPEYQLLGFPAGTERARILFPRSCLNLALSPFVSIERMWREPDGIIVVDSRQYFGENPANIFYHFNPDLTLRLTEVSSDFEGMHAEAYAHGWIDHPLSAQERLEFSNVTYLRAPGPRKGAE